MKTTRQLISEIQDRSVFVLVWAIVWRFLVAYLLIMMVIGVLDVIIN